MPSELTSRDRPTGLRLAGFLTLAVGGALLGVGAVSTWASFEGFDVVTSGIDVWEGLVALGAAFVTLVGVLATRVVGVGAARVVAVIVIAGGLVAASLAVSAAIRADTRFTDAGQRDRMARELAARAGLPVEPIRAAIEEQFDRRFSLSLGPGIFLTIAGGGLCVAGGLLTLRWVSLERGDPRPGAGEASAAGVDPAS